jgi:murein L,D-transpeptidase YafK
VRVLRTVALAAALIFAGVGALLIFGAAPFFAVYEEARLFIRDQHRIINRSLNLPLPGTPVLTTLDARLAAKSLEIGAPVFIRIFKRDSELELWMMRDGRYVLFETYPICYWSGRLGPKLRQGDAQSPEGFYSVSAAQLNPNSQYYRSFDLGFPNAFDRAYRRTGAHLMVHGACVSRGCYAMTDPVMGEIWALVTAALAGGQPRFDVHVFPFRLKDWRLRLYAGHESAPFWAELKPGYDAFEAHRLPPQIQVCGRRYVVAPARNSTASEQPSGVQSGCPPAAAVFPADHISRTPRGARGVPKPG